MVNNIMKRLIVALIIIAAAAAPALKPHAAYAAVGDGGTWGGGVGLGYNTSNGWGWYRYNVDNTGITPSYFFSGSNWATVRGICAAEGTNYVIGFTLRNPSGLHSIHDDVSWGEGSLSNFRGNDGLPWMNRAQALALYNTLPASQKVGFTFGSNVGWFCYSDSNWGTTGTTTVNRATAKPGDQIIWDQTLINNGPTSTGSTSIWSQTYGAGGFSIAGFEGLHDVTSGVMASGARRDPVSYQTYTVQVSDAGKTLCMELQWDPVSSSGARHGRSSKCVYIEYDFNIIGTTTVNITSPAVGQTVTWTHTLRNTGPTSTGPTKIQSSTLGTGVFTIVPPEVDVVSGVKNSRSEQMANGFTRTFNQNYVIKAADGGKTLCQQLRWTPTDSDGGTNGIAGPVCVTVPYDYELQPDLNLDKPYATYGESITVGRSVTNTGPTFSKPAQWQFHVGLIPAGGGDPAAGLTYHSSTPCAAYSMGGCVLQSSGSNVTFPLLSTDLGNYLYNIPATQQVGSRICYILSVKDRSHDSTDWVSVAECTKVVKRPLVQVWGHDVRVGDQLENGLPKDSASVRTHSFNIGSGAGTITYGSWAEYGIFAPSNNGQIISYSGSSLAGSSGRLKSAADADQKLLTFANTVSPAGRWAPPAALNSIVTAAVNMQSFASYGASSNIDAAPVADGDVKRIDWSNAQIQGTFTKTATVIIRSSTNLTIMGNIELAATSVTALGKAAQIIIIAPNIIVNSNVTRIDAWLVAVPNGDTAGVVSTCDAITSPYWSGLAAGGVCDVTPLIINGAVMARELQLRRTSGGEAGRLSDPAEIINLRADAFMMGTSSSSGLPISTLMTTELPPRF